VKLYLFFSLKITSRFLAISFKTYEILIVFSWVDIEGIVWLNSFFYPCDFSGFLLKVLG